MQLGNKTETTLGTDKSSNGKGSQVHRDRNATNPDQFLKSPGKKSRRAIRRLCVCVCGQFWQVCIRNTIHDFFM